MDNSASTIVFASGNAGKIQELNELLTPIGYNVRSQGEFGVESVDETAVTFVENALLKAREATTRTQLPALADDSGLEVDALKGAPGLYSARYAEMHGQGSGDVANYEWLLDNLKDVPLERRTARFRSVVVYLKHEHDPAPLIAEGSWEGHILFAPEGDGGFGYDPVFCNHDTNSATALLDKNSKNRLSHRGKAVARMIQLLAQQKQHA